MKFGLSEKYWKIFESLVLFPLTKEGAKIFIFGSRARGDHKSFSDVDILLEPPNKSKEFKIKFFQVKEDIQESTFPFKVDFVLMEDLSENYRDQILKEKIPLD